MPAHAQPAGGAADAAERPPGTVPERDRDAEAAGAPPPAAGDAAARPDGAADDEVPAILLVAAAALVDAIAEVGFAPRQVARLADLTGNRHGFSGRVIVLGPEAVDEAVEGGIDAAVDRLRTAHPLVDVVLWRPDLDPDAERRALRAGARDVVLSQAPARVAAAVSRIVRDQRMITRAADIGYVQDRDATFHGMLSRSRRMWDLFDVARRVATSDAAVLIVGETGTGKELLARAIHRMSGRKGRFVPVNCAALPESLVDSELFGHEKGAFTGAVRAKAGLFRHADHGTLLLDEIGRVPEAVQDRLLRVLQERAVRPVGAHGESPIDVRVIAATSTELEADVAAGRFREDLYYRLDVIRLEVPPLRERPEDILFLFGQFARVAARTYAIERPDVTDDFLDALLAHPWPGNVRELENFAERLMLTHPQGRVDGTVVERLLAGRPSVESAGRHDRAARGPVPPRRGPAAPPEATAPGAPPRPRDRAAAEPPVDLDRSLEDFLAGHVDRLERRYLVAVLRETRGMVGEAARRAGIGRRTMRRRMERHGLDKMDFRRSADP